jgi:hypothetical protein
MTPTQRFHRRVALLLVLGEKTTPAEAVRTLASATPLIDSWGVVLRNDDNDMRAQIHDALVGLPGEVVVDADPNIASVQSAAVRRLNATSDYVLLLETGDELIVEDGYDIAALKATLNRTLYRLTVRVGELHCARPALLNSVYEFFFRGEITPLLDCRDTVESIGDIDGIHISRVDSVSPPLNTPDLQKLEEVYRAEADGALRSHYATHVARGYQHAGQFSNALDWFEQRAQFGGTNDEVCEAFLDAGHCARMLHRPSRDVLDFYLRAHDANTSRAEPLYYAAKSLRESNRLSLAYLFAKAAAKVSRPELGNCLEVDVYDWRAQFEVSVVSYYVGEHKEGLTACQAVLGNPRVPDGDRELTRENLNHYIRALTTGDLRRDR